MATTMASTQAAASSAAKAILPKLSKQTSPKNLAEVPRIMWNRQAKTPRNPQTLIDTMHKRLYPELYQDGKPLQTLKNSPRIDTSWKTRVSPRKRQFAEKWGEKLVRTFIPHTRNDPPIEPPHIQQYKTPHNPRPKPTYPRQTPR